MTKIMLDSGAFSAWTKDRNVDLDKYIAFIKRFEDDLESYVNLDVIPGKPGNKPTEKEVDFSANKGWENYQHILAEGLNAIPVFHLGEDTKWLENMIESGVDYIGLGGLVGRPAQLQKKWLDKIFDMITDDEGYPIVKVHGFGVTSNWAVMRYPWYSVDSISWRIHAMYGKVAVPHYDNIERMFIYDKPPYIIPTSIGTRESARYFGLHITTNTQEVKDILLEYLEEVSIELKDLESEDMTQRLICNANYYDNMSRLAYTDCFKAKKRIFFDKSIKSKLSPFKNDETIMYLGIGTPKDIAILSGKVPEPRVLISYLSCPKSPQDDYFKKYVVPSKEVINA